MTNLIEQDTRVCKNGHVDSKRVFTGGAWRCNECVREQRRRRRDKERAGLALTKHQRKKLPVCPSGCLRVCLCEEL